VTVRLEPWQADRLRATGVVAETNREQLPSRRVSG
jgi:hypothetical protein